MAAPLTRPAVVVADRDGTLLTETGYLRAGQEFELIPGAAQGLARLAQAGIRVAVATNQSAIARGWLSEPELEVIHEQIAEALRAQDNQAAVELWLHCPHHPTIGDSEYTRDCDCRKPNPGMILEAARHFDCAPRDICVLGDSLRDLAAADAADASSILVTTGKGFDEWELALERSGSPPPTAPDFLRAVQWLLTLPVPQER